VLEASGDRIRLGITAPRNVPVLREEVLRRAQGDLSVTNDPAVDESRYFVECA
jgi:sRNA-binding carbon storage regulator CsrA